MMNLKRARRTYLVLFWSMCLGFPQSAGAYDFISDGLYYNILSSSEHTVEISRSTYIPYSFTKVDVPESVEYNGIDYTVTGIGEYAFERCNTLTSVKFTSLITSIGKGAFSGCNLETLEIPSSVTSIGDGAFSSNNSLWEVTLPEWMEHIPARLFSNCSGMLSVKFPENLLTVGEYAFASNTKLTRINLPETLESIGFNAFGGTGVKTLVIPDNVKIIEGYAFSGCKSLTKITIGSSVEKIGDKAFDSYRIIEEVYSLNPIPPVIEEKTFDLETQKYKATLYVPKGSEELYKNAKYWKNFSKIREIEENEDNGVEDIITDLQQGIPEVFTLDGKKLDINTEEEIRGLAPGIYIINGEKCFVTR